MSEPLLVCEHLSYRYLERFPALDGVSLRVDAGETRRAARRERLRQVDAAEGARRPAVPRRRHVPRVRQRRHRGHARGRAVLEGVPLAGRVRLPELRRPGLLADGARGGRVRPAAARPARREQVEQRVRDVLAMLEIEDLADRAPYQLSGGQKKRVAIAVGAGHEPRGAAVRRADGGARPAHPAVAARAPGRACRAPARRSSWPPTTSTSSSWVADRCVMLSEDHRVVAEGTPAELLADSDGACSRRT